MNRYAASFGAQSNVCRTMAGYLAQIYVGDEIVWEKGPFESPEAAADAACLRIQQRAKKVFA